MSQCASQWMDERRIERMREVMRSSWSGFQPQNEIVKLQWAVLEASQLEVTAQEFARLLQLTGLNLPEDDDGSLDEDELGVIPYGSP